MRKLKDKERKKERKAWKTDIKNTTEEKIEDEVERDEVPTDIGNEKREAVEWKEGCECSQSQIREKQDNETFCDNNNL